MTWGFVAWFFLSGRKLFFERHDHSRALLVRRQDVHVCPLDDVLASSFMRVRISVATSLEILASLVAWHIWKARCTKALDGSQVHPSITLASIWTDCIHTLMAIWAKHAGGLLGCHFEACLFS